MLYTRVLDCHDLYGGLGKVSQRQIGRLDSGTFVVQSTSVATSAIRQSEFSIGGTLKLSKDYIIIIENVHIYFNASRN